VVQVAHKGRRYATMHAMVTQGGGERATKRQKEKREQ